MHWSLGRIRRSVSRWSSGALGRSARPRWFAPLPLRMPNGSPSSISNALRRPSGSAATSPSKKLSSPSCWADLHRGRLIEQIIGQEIKATETRLDVPLRFWVRDKAQSQAELDFLIVTNQGVIPIEAKSGAEGKLRSLHQYARLGDAPLAVRLYAGLPSNHDVNFENIAYRLINVPYYAAALIPRYVHWGDAP